jgi:hypothetical protein
MRTTFQRHLAISPRDCRLRFSPARRRLRPINRGKVEASWWFGKTPIQTFLDAIALAKEKMIAA